MQRLEQTLTRQLNTIGPAITAAVETYDQRAKAIVEAVDARITILDNKLEVGIDPLIQAGVVANAPYCSGFDADDIVCKR